MHKVLPYLACDLESRSQRGGHKGGIREENTRMKLWKWRKRGIYLRDLKHQLSREEGSNCCLHPLAFGINETPSSMPEEGFTNGPMYQGIPIRASVLWRAIREDCLNPFCPFQISFFFFFFPGQHEGLLTWDLLSSYIGLMSDYL